MPENWTQHKVENLIKEKVLVIGDGYRAKNSELSNDGLPFARAGNINQGFLFDGAECLDNSNLAKAKEKISRNGDVVFTSKGTVGRFAFVKETTKKFVYSPQLCYWRVLSPEVIEPRFLYFWMHGQEFSQQSNGVKGLTDMADYVSLNNQRRFEITIPPIEEQRRIAEILSALDEKIELNLEMNRTLEKIAQATFKHWFVDFQFPGFDGELVDVLPKGWKKVRLEDLVDTISATHKFPNDKIIFLNTSDISEGQVLRSDYSDVKTLPGQAKKSIKKNDILYSEIRPINKRFAYIDFDADDYVVSTKLMVLRAKSSVDSIVLYYFLKSEDIIRELQMLAESRSGTFPQITFFHIKNLEMIVPDDKTLELYTSILKSNFEKINSNLRLNQTLTQIRNGLLPKLMSGKIRVAE